MRMPEGKPITEEMNVHEEWYKQVDKIKTAEDLMAFVNHVLNDYNHDYGTACHAAAACALAGAWLGSRAEGITGFQASFVMWLFIRHWQKENNKCGLKLVDYDDMLYPQYGYKYEKVISEGVWESLQKEAKQNLETENACPEVVAHWKSIVDGNVPFGYEVKEDIW